jgi:hypothetical protein
MAVTSSALRAGLRRRVAVVGVVVVAAAVAVVVGVAIIVATIGWRNINSLDFYFGDHRFESRPGYQLYELMYFKVFLSPY